jgi:hypothetical protein
MPWSIILANQTGSLQNHISYTGVSGQKYSFNEHYGWTLLLRENWQIRDRWSPLRFKLGLRFQKRLPTSQPAKDKIPLNSDPWADCHSYHQSKRWHLWTTRHQCYLFPVFIQSSKFDLLDHKQKGVQHRPRYVWAHPEEVSKPVWNHILHNQKRVRTVSWDFEIQLQDQMWLLPWGYAVPEKARYLKKVDEERSPGDHRHDCVRNGNQQARCQIRGASLASKELRGVCTRVW